MVASESLSIAVGGDFSLYTVEEFEKSGQMDLVSKECEEAGAVPAESHCLELIKDGKSFILEDDEFSAMLKDTKDIIAYRSAIALYHSS